MMSPNIKLLLVWNIRCFYVYNCEYLRQILGPIRHHYLKDRCSDQTQHQTSTPAFPKNSKTHSFSCKFCISVLMEIFFVVSENKMHLVSFLSRSMSHILPSSWRCPPNRNVSTYFFLGPIDPLFPFISHKMFTKLSLLGDLKTVLRMNF